MHFLFRYYRNCLSGIFCYDCSDLNAYKYTKKHAHSTLHKAFCSPTVKILSPSCLNQNPILRMYRVGWMRKCDDWRLLLTHEYIKNTEKTNPDQGRGHITKTSLRAQSKELYFMYERFKGKTNTSTNTWASFTAIVIAWLE